jgi:hypothetical protein
MFTYVERGGHFSAHFLFHYSSGNKLSSFLCQMTGCFGLSKVKKRNTVAEAGS